MSERLSQVDKIILRQIYLSKYSSGYEQKIIDAYKRGDKELIAIIRDAFDGEDVAKVLKSKGFTDALDGFLSKQAKEIGDIAFKEMDALSKSEELFTAKTLSYQIKSVLGVASNKIYSFWKDLYKTTKNLIVDAITKVATFGGNVIDSIIGTKSQNYKDGVINLRNVFASATANFQVGEVAAAARERVYKDAGYSVGTILATLDFRTCLICGPKDGTEIKIGKEKGPSFHPRCRCLLVPSNLLKNSERPFVKSERSVKDIPKSERAGIIGRTTVYYPDFFERLEDKDKLIILGPARFDLYKSGQFKITDFSTDGKILTLDELDSL